MTKSKRFEPIKEIAATSAKDLSRAMAEAARKVADLERQLQQLQSYRDDYVRNSAPGSALTRAPPGSAHSAPASPALNPAGTGTATPSTRVG